MFFFSDFQKKMVCTSPFKLIENVGCVYLYIKTKHNYYEGLSHCQSLGGELYEFENFDRQNQDVLNYLVSNGGKSCEYILYSYKK